MRNRTRKRAIPPRTHGTAILARLMSLLVAVVLVLGLVLSFCGGWGVGRVVRCG